MAFLEKISKRAEERKDKGGDPVIVFWQQYLECILLLANHGIKEKIGH